MTISSTEPQAAIPPFELRHRLARSLEHAGMRASQMQSYLGVSESTMTNYLAGRTRPKPGAMRAWALATGVPYEWLLTGAVPPGGGSDVGVSDTSWNRQPATIYPLRRCA